MASNWSIPATAAVPVIAVALALGGCETKAETGTLVGATGGAVVGSMFGSGTGRVLAVGAGAVLGGILGNRVGNYMDEKDRLEAEAALRRAQTAPVGSQVAWNNPDSGHSGTIEPTREGQDSSGNLCREFLHTVRTGETTVEDKGVACRNPDGTWTTLDE